MRLRPSFHYPCGQTEYHLKKTVEALADSAYLRDPATRWARTHAEPFARYSHAEATSLS